MKANTDAFWKTTTLVTLSALLLLAFRSPGSPALAADTITARQFILIDAAGKPIGEWGRDPDHSNGISLRIYDPTSKSGDPSIRMLAADGGVDLYFTGERDSGAVWLTTSKDRSSLALFDTCRAPSHDLPLRTAEVMLSAEKTTGKLSVVRRTALTVDGEHAHGQETLLSVPDAEARTAPAGAK